MVGLLLIVLGFILWLAAGWFIVGLALIILGLILFFAPGPWYGYPYYRGRRPPP